MKKLILLLLILPLFFACTDDTSSSSEPDPKADPKPIEKVGCSVDSECNTAAGELCENGECVYVPRCGNDIIDSDEECDGENLNGNPGRCSSNCKLDWSMLGCGDGLTTPELGEECDDGNKQDGDGCSCNCKIERPECNSAADCADSNAYCVEGRCVSNE